MIIITIMILMSQVSICTVHIWVPFWSIWGEFWIIWGSLFGHAGCYFLFLCACIMLLLLFCCGLIKSPVKKDIKRYFLRSVTPQPTRNTKNSLKIKSSLPKLLRSGRGEGHECSLSTEAPSDAPSKGISRFLLPFDQGAQVRFHVFLAQSAGSSTNKTLVRIDNNPRVCSRFEYFFAY